MIYMGCVTDFEWKRAVCEQYPNRKCHSADTKKRARMTAEKRDIPDLILKSRETRSRRYYIS